MCASSRLSVFLVCFMQQERERDERELNNATAAPAAKKRDEMRFLIDSFILPIGLKMYINIWMEQERQCHGKQNRCKEIWPPTMSASTHIQTLCSEWGSNAIFCYWKSSLLQPKVEKQRQKEREREHTKAISNWLFQFFYSFFWVHFT